LNVLNFRFVLNQHHGLNLRINFVNFESQSPPHGSLSEAAALNCQKIFGKNPSAVIGRSSDSGNAPGAYYWIGT